MNYKKTDAAMRGQYAIHTDQYLAIIELARQKQLTELFIISTCNRTELYALHADADTLITLLCTQTSGNSEIFRRLAYVKKGMEAIEHLFNVTSGLDSQVLGDYEIIGQVKQSAKLAKEQGMVGPFMERLLNSALQASKAIKTRTALSDGTVSVSFAAIQYIKDHIPQYRTGRILLVGTGKIGRNTCRNIVDYLGNKQVTLVNRTEEKARQLAAELSVQSAPAAALGQLIATADIIITATSATAPIICAHHLQQGRAQLIIDLSVPNNVDAAVRELPCVTVMNVDELAAHKDRTFEQRKAEVPKARAIITEHMAEFTSWLDTRKYVPVLVSLKAKLQQLDTALPLRGPVLQHPAGNPQRIQKIINATALRLKSCNSRGCHYIQAINEYFG